MRPVLPKRILCPVDLSKLSGAALSYANEVAQCTGARLTVMFANSFLPPPYFTEARLQAFKQQYDESFQDAENALREFAEVYGVSSGLLVVEGLPADAIEQVAADTHSDLIVLGTHGRGGVNRWMLGSVAERVLRASGVPVITVRDSGGHVPPKRILCPVNDTETARRALEYAAGLAACFQAEVTVMHVSDRGKDAIPDICAWLDAGERLNCTLRHMPSEGEAAEKIVALSRDFDLLVIGSRHRTFSDSTVLGTTTARVVRHAACPVLTYVDGRSR